MERTSSSYREQRNIKERDRRLQMKHLINILAPLVHPQPSMLSVPQVLHHATNHVKQLQEKIEMLKQLKTTQYNEQSSSSSREPVLDIQCRDSILEVNLVTGLTENFMSQQLISVLQEEGAEIISFSYHRTADSVIYTIRSQAISPRIGMEISSICRRLNDLLYS